MGPISGHPCGAKTQSDGHSNEPLRRIMIHPLLRPSLLRGPHHVSVKTGSIYPLPARLGTEGDRKTSVTRGHPPDGGHRRC